MAHRTPITMAASAPVELARHALRLLGHHARPLDRERQRRRSSQAARMIVNGEPGPRRNSG